MTTTVRICGASMTTIIQFARFLARDMHSSWQERGEIATLSVGDRYVKVLLSFVGNRDPYREGSSEYGPVLSLLHERQFSKVFLFCTGPDYIERAKTVERISSGQFEIQDFTFINLELESVVDYEEIYARLESVLTDTLERAGYGNASFSILLDPGTPQMQT
jgi:hypothetical protein